MLIASNILGKKLRVNTLHIASISFPQAHLLKIRVCKAFCNLRIIEYGPEPFLFSPSL